MRITPKLAGRTMARNRSAERSLTGPNRTGGSGWIGTQKEQVEP